MGTITNRHRWAASLLLLFLPALLPAQESGPGPRLAWGPDGRIVVEAGGLLARFDLESDRQELLNDAATAFALSDYVTFQQQARLEVPSTAAGGPGTMLALAWSPAGDTLAGGTNDGHVLLWEIEGGELWADVGVEPASPAASLSFSADGRRLLSAFEDGRAVLWDIEAREVVKQFAAPRTAEGELRDEITEMALSPDGQRILATRRRGDDAVLQLLDDSGKVLWERAGRGFQFTPDGAAVLALAPPFRIVALYRVEDAEALQVFEPPGGVRELHAARLSPDGRRLVAAGYDSMGETLILWNFDSGRVIRSPPRRRSPVGSSRRPWPGRSRWAHRRLSHRS
jgi:WD40 repeat protein